MAHNAGVSQHQLADEYGCNKSSIWRVINNRTHHDPSYTPKPGKLGAPPKPRPLCKCGCGKNVTKPRNRYLVGHNMVKRKDRDAVLAQTWDRCTPTDTGYDTECWLWNGPVNNSGYAIVTIGTIGNKTTTSRHRHLYSLMHPAILRNSEIQVDHMCNQKRCMRLDHMRAAHRVTHMREHMSPITADDIKLMRQLRTKGWSYQQLADKFGYTNQYSVANIINGHRWTNADSREARSAEASLRMSERIMHG